MNDDKGWFLPLILGVLVGFLVGWFAHVYHQKQQDRNTIRFELKCDR